jgi:hypothetical protein
MAILRSRGRRSLGATLLGGHQTLPLLAIKRGQIDAHRLRVGRAQEIKKGRPSRKNQGRGSTNRQSGRREPCKGFEEGRRRPLKSTDRKTGDSQCALPAGPGIVSVSPFFAKIKASNLAGSVLLVFFETSCVLPGGS